MPKIKRKMTRKRTCADIYKFSIIYQFKQKAGCQNMNTKIEIYIHKYQVSMCIQKLEIAF